jgi:hypothetical protein
MSRGWQLGRRPREGVETMLFLIHGSESKKAFVNFETRQRRPNGRQLARLENDLAELEAAAERVRKILKANQRRRPK